MLSPWSGRKANVVFAVPLCLCIHCQCCSPSAWMRNFSSPSLHVTVRKNRKDCCTWTCTCACTWAQIFASTHVSLCAWTPHTWVEHRYLFMLAAAAAEAIEVGAAPRSLPPQSACLECCSACSEYRSACCSPTRPKTIWTPSKFCFRDTKAGRVRITNTEWQMQ